MRIIAVRTLKEYCEEFPQSERTLLSWYEEAETADWKNSNELKSQYRNASVLNDKVAVFKSREILID